MKHTLSITGRAGATTAGIVGNAFVSLDVGAGVCIE